MRVLAVAAIASFIAATSSVAGPLGEYYPGLWANSPAACAAAKKGKPDITVNVAKLTFSQLSWEEAVCKVSGMRKSGKGFDRMLSCNGGNGALLWKGTLHVVNSKQVTLSGGNLTQGTFRFCMK